MRQAVAEIARVAPKDPLLAAEGAVAFLELVAPALGNVDNSSGAIGGAVDRAIATLVPIVAAALADQGTREKWLERLWAAHEADRMPYIERLVDFWGDLCASKDFASAWADRLLPPTREALRLHADRRVFFHGATACLSALLRADRHAEILDLLAHESFWPYRRWAVKALAGTGRPDEAIRLAESTTDRWMSDLNADALCEEILLGCGRIDEAYARYGLRVNSRDTYLATFRAIAARYPAKEPREILADLVCESPGQEGKWFAAAKDAGLFDEALELAGRGGADPRTLGRAARDFAAKRPEFAVHAGLLSLDGFIHQGAEDVEPGEVRAACEHTLHAAEACGRAPEVREEIRRLAGDTGGFVRSILRDVLDRGQ